MSDDNSPKSVVKRTLIPWRTPIIGEKLYLILIKLVIFNEVHIASRDTILKKWNDVACDFWKQPELLGYDHVSTRQLRGIFEALIDTRGKQFRQNANSSGSSLDPNVGDGELSLLDEMIKQVVLERNEAEECNAECKKRAAELTENCNKIETTVLLEGLSGASKKKRRYRNLGDDISFGSPSGSSNQDDNVGNDKLLSLLSAWAPTSPQPIVSNSVDLDAKVIRTKMKEYFKDTSTTKSIIMDTLNDSELVEVVIAQITMDVIVVTFCDKNHSFESDYFMNFMEKCGLQHLPAAKLFSLLTNIKDDFERQDI